VTDLTIKTNRKLQNQMDQMEYANEMQKIRKVGSLSPTPPLHLYNDIHPPSGIH
jgi:hypothetical protein